MTKGPLWPESNNRPYRGAHSGWTARRKRTRKGGCLSAAMLFVLCAMALIALAACSDSSHRNAPSGNKDNTPANIVNFPAGYRNVAYKCVGPDMVYVTSSGQGDSHPSSVFVIHNDERCRS